MIIVNEISLRMENGTTCHYFYFILIETADLCDCCI